MEKEDNNDGYDIVTLKNLCDYVDVGPSIINRWMGLYGFPRPASVMTCGRAKNAWREKEVLDWLVHNRQLVMEAKQNRMMNGSRRGASRDD